VCCSVLQRVAVWEKPSYTLRISRDSHTHFVTRTLLASCSMLQCVAACCSVLQCVAVQEMPAYALHISRDSHTYFVTRTLLAGCIVLQCVAACCSVLQCERCHLMLPVFLVIHTHILSHPHRLRGSEIWSYDHTTELWGKTKENMFLNLSHLAFSAGERYDHTQQKYGGWPNKKGFCLSHPAFLLCMIVVGLHFTPARNTGCDKICVCGPREIQKT